LQGSSVQAWNEPWTGNIDHEWQDVELFCDIARALERACFDYVLIEDSSYVGSPTAIR
ncbi:MAG: putative dibenzothiophene desulfurization enzyme, partial [Pseudonocardiales bacterium]|nr:putative dibenzothiophene desulfurization enzyme [Pseudonocardiales bacterium]